MSVGTMLLVAAAWIAIVLVSAMLILPRLCIGPGERR
jgi:hypothetical protein